MFVGTLQIDLYLPGSLSLKEKRFILQSLKSRLRNKFNVSVSEVDHNDLWQRAGLGIAVVTNDAQYAHRVLSKVVDLVESNGEVVVIDYGIENR